MHIPFNSLKAQLAPCEDDIRAAFERVLDSGWFLMGPEVTAFEGEFAAWTGRDACVALNSGTDALLLALRALGAAGGEVVLPAHTALPCYHAVLAAGCTPVFAEVEEVHYTLDPASAERMIGPQTKAVIGVHLYGQPCALPQLKEVCDRAGVPLIEDCAQSHGARLDGVMTGNVGRLAAYSFYPTKNLGALGDGGAVCCDAGAFEDALRLERQYGEAKRYDSVTPGVNSRMDEMQAAFLRARLTRLEQDTAQRRELAAAYDQGLADTPVTTPAVRAGAEHVYHLYVVRAPRRDALAAHLRERGIGTAVHYPIPGHKQTLFTEGGHPFRADDLGRTEKLADEILSLPLYPGLPKWHVETVCKAIKDFYSGAGS